MLEVTELKAFNLEGAIRGMRQPFKNTEKSDSIFYCDDSLAHDRLPCREGCGISLGPNDLRIAQGLIKAGSPHDKFMRQIFVSMDINAPIYWWKEMDTYKVGTVANSESTMHTITKFEFTSSMFSSDDSYYNDPSMRTGVNKDLTLLQEDINLLNVIREFWLKETDEDKKKKLWKTIIEKLPSAYMQKRTWTGNYRILRSINEQRENHRLNEWKIFRDALRELPYANELIFYKKVNENVN